MDLTDWSAETWGAIGSGATALAFLVSAWALGLQVKDRRRTAAEGVTVWVDDRYQHGDAGEMVRLVSVTLKNAGTHPVFDVQVGVGYGHFGGNVTSIGPLAVPTKPVLPPGAEWAWPIQDLLRSVEIEGRLVAEVSFRDPANRWWLRDFAGNVKRWRSRMRRSLKRINDDEISLDAVLGAMSWENPVSVAAAFWTALGEPPSPERTAELTALCTPESLPAWGDFDGIAEMLSGHGLASFPAYPAPGVSYVKFPENIDEAIVVSGPTLMAAKIMTLQYRDDLEPHGWRVFALGTPIPPESVPPPGVMPKTEEAL
ncbi:hypothetical protein AERO_01610 [Aeromicrobium fastidiosum]|uniref:hypothetical protein n=1 Tax=Aeromicrobium fastidiosum TaxID=52699 RepID=UPI0020231D65|nr:hypothetical protein [Aeromicrobium fastidiosum]MCL8250067.1 hypothetical protein [Aeromicrobium fastidiosum]